MEFAQKFSFFTVIYTNQNVEVNKYLEFDDS